MTSEINTLLVTCHRWAIEISRFGYLVLGFQGYRINHADVVGFRGCIIVVSIFNEIACAVICEVRNCVVEKGNRPDKIEEDI